MHRWKLTLLTIVSLLLLSAAVAGLWGPGWLRDRATGWVRTETGRTLTIGKVSVNLLTLSLELRDVALSETDQQTPFLTWERLYVALSPRSFWHRAPVVSELQLERPAIRIERHADGRFNFSDLLDRKGSRASEPAASDEPARFSLNNLTVHGGRIEFIDRTPAAPVTHRVEALELGIPFVGNLPYLADRYVQPLLRATVNDTAVELKGELKPFADTQEYSLKLKFDGIDLPYYLGYLPDTLPVVVRNGRLDVNLDLTYRASATSKPVLELAGRCDLVTLDLRERDGRPLLFLPLLEARLAPSQPLERRLHLAAVTIDNLQSWLDRNPAGTWNVMRLAGPATASPPAATAASPAAPLQLQIDRLRLRNGRLEVRDQLPDGGFATTLRAIALDIDDFTLARGTPFRLALALASERGEQFEARGEVTVSPLTLDLTFDARNLPLAAYRPYYQAQAAAVIGGTLDARTRLHIAPKQPLLLSDTDLAIHNLDLPLPDGEGFRTAGATLQGGRFDLAANRFEAAELAFAGLDARFSRDKTGRWSIFDRNYPLLAKLAEPVTVAPPQPQQQPAADPRFSWRIGRIALQDGRIAVRDKLPAEPARFDIAALDLNVRNLAAPDKVPGSFDLQGRFQKNGLFQASGTLLPDGPELRAELQLRRIPLTAFAPYLGDAVHLVLVDGALDTRLSANLAKTAGGWRGRIAGDLGISRLYCLDATHREDLLRWERLQLSGIETRLDPPDLKIAAVTLSDYYARILLDEQGRLNLAEIFAPPAAREPGPPRPETAAPAARKPQIRIGRITLQGGRVNFTDRHMARPFSAEMLQLGGRIQGLSSTPGARAEVDLRGRLRNESPLTIAGTLNPLADPLFVDLKLDFTGIELSPLSPYAGTYVGYLIERGKLNVGLAYLVENGQLKASNKLFIDQFTFGEQVASDKATTLPVRLAVALLKDRNGEIHLDIPVYGDINDPRFSIWGIVWQVIKNLLVKAATSPLALLGALAGSGEDFSAITFPHGSSALTAAEQGKLAKIIEALRDRPDLKIEIKGYADPDNDPEGYRRELLQARVRREKLIDLRKSQGDAAPNDSDAVTVTPAEYPEYLWRVYKAADFPKPRNLVGLLQHLPDPELEKLLLANIRIGPEELAALAQARARAVTAALTAPGGIPRERVFLATTDYAAPPAVAGLGRSRVEFGMAVK
ncbi:MAG: DUF748 domain-containing protein [Deltaproteobacteria bacterium]|nr:MAG: DUF748 domain-containing protein [Deltaproteobacteria bacterium]